MPRYPWRMPLLPNQTLENRDVTSHTARSNRWRNRQRKRYKHSAALPHAQDPQLQFVAISRYPKSEHLLALSYTYPQQHHNTTKSQISQQHNNTATRTVKMIKTILLIILTIFSTPTPTPHQHALTPAVPPVGVFIVAGCGADLLINILLTILGYVYLLKTNNTYSHHCRYFPGHIHAFYIEYVYYKHRDAIRAGTYDGKPASGVYSQKVQNGGTKGVVVQQPPVGEPVAQQGYGTATV